MLLRITRMAARVVLLVTLVVLPTSLIAGPTKNGDPTHGGPRNVDVANSSAEIAKLAAQLESERAFAIPLMVAHLQQHVESEQMKVIQNVSANYGTTRKYEYLKALIEELNKRIAG